MTKLNIALFTLIGVLSASFRAGASCRDISETIKTENWRIGNRSPRKAQLNALIKADDALLSQTLIPLQSARNRTLAVYDARDGANAESLKAVETANLFIQEVLLKTPAKKDQLTKLRQTILQAPAVALSDQLRDFAAHAKLRAADADQIVQLANAVKMLETSAKDWQAAEQEVLQNYLSGDQSLVMALSAKILELKQRLQADIEQLKQGRSLDQNAADGATKQVIDATARRGAEAAELQAIDAADKTSAANLTAAQQAYERDCNFTMPERYNPDAY